MKICPNCKKNYGEEKVYCEECGYTLEVVEVQQDEAINKDKKGKAEKMRKRIPSWITVPVFVLSVLLNIILAYNVDNMSYVYDRCIRYHNDYGEIKNKIDICEEKHIDYDELIEEIEYCENNHGNYDALDEKIEFYEEFVVIVPDDGSNLYHKYGCSECDTSSFRAYNIALAKNEGYNPCSECY